MAGSARLQAAQALTGCQLDPRHADLATLPALGCAVRWTAEQAALPEALQQSPLQTYYQPGLLLRRSAPAL